MAVWRTAIARETTVGPGGDCRMASRQALSHCRTTLSAATGETRSCAPGAAGMLEQKMGNARAAIAAARVRFLLALRMLAVILSIRETEQGSFHTPICR